MASSLVSLHVGRRFFSVSPVISKKSTISPGDLVSIFRGSKQQEEIEAREVHRHNARQPAILGGYTSAELSRYEPVLGEVGRIYSPEDLSFDAKRPAQQALRQANLSDDFELYGVNPLDEYKSFNLLSPFVSELGRIRPREQTGLSAKNQRRLGKAVRRARALNLLPTTSRHPEFGQSRPLPGFDYLRRQ